MNHKPLLNVFTRGDYFEINQNEESSGECKCTAKRTWEPTYVRPPTTTKDRTRFGWLGLFLFLIALVTSLYLVWECHEYHERNNNRVYQDDLIKRELKLVTLFNRHGDRAPSDELPDVDKHKNVIALFWPNGLHNLTDLGKMRSYKLGLALRETYDDQFVGFDHRQVLAFSSQKMRCIESLQNTLKGLFELEGPKTRGVETIARWRNDSCAQNNNSCLPQGSGSAEEWKLIRFDTESIRTLTERDVEQCRYRRENPSPLDTNLRLHPEVMALPGIQRLEQIMTERYGLSGLQGGAMTAIFSTITSELNLVRTRESIQYADHFSDWIGEVVATTADGKHNITLYDIFEQATVYKYRDQTLGVAKWLEIGPMMTSMLDSQQVALNRPPGTNSFFNVSTKLYEDKRLIFYSSHDSILQRILQHLDLIDFQPELSYVQRFTKWKQYDGLEFDKFMDGLSMSAYGLSIKFELWEATDPSDSSLTYPYVTLSVYNEEESRFGDIVYRPLRLGRACARLFGRKYPQLEGTPQGYGRFYNPNIPSSIFFECPFELFKNVTADLMVEEQKFNELC